MDHYSFIANSHPSYIESLYREFKQDNSRVDPELKKFFEGFDFAVSGYEENGAIAFSPKEFKVFNFIQAYRAKAHLIAKTNPIRQRKDRHAHLDLNANGLSEEDLDIAFIAGEELGLGKATLREIVAHLEQIYNRAIGFEFNSVVRPDIRQWLLERIEGGAKKIDFTLDQKKRILQKLNDTAVFEQFLNKKYIGQKRFSLEGGESAIPALDAIINASGDLGVEEVVIGMAHRGRLNVLANIMGKTYEHIFNEFEGNIDPDLTMGDGDVKYHLGYSSEVKTPSGKTVNLKLAPNPSHLEAVSPVVQGFVRAKADLLYNRNFQKILPIIIHGDASVAGQGVVYETLQMSQLKGYYTGGTIHFVINNQIGFTTDFDDARSSDYCTSLAASVHAPVFHVNGDDVEAVVFAAELAAAFRNEFDRDVFIDMVCYRRHGHNEGDDPKFTQPGLYSLIDKHPDPRQIYTQSLIETNTIEANLAEEMNEKFWQQLQDRLEMVKEKPLPYHYQQPELDWKKLRRATAEDFLKSPKTAISRKLFLQINEQLAKFPEGFKPLKKMEKQVAQKWEMVKNNQVDWAMAELTAYGSLLLEGHDVRISGQDVKRGTFSHRHAVLYDKDSNTEFFRLNHLAEKQAEFRIYNSLLSEFGVLGFEFGYSLASPQHLTIWEAQFGDFANGAQTIIDQFISSSESKWQRMSGLTLLLPHGYEGQGPEHSSARMERFLQMCAELNMVVANCTTPANFFHLLRRQIAWPFRKPLIHFSPKSLLRHPDCVSPVEDFTSGGFQETLLDVPAGKKQKIRKILFCSGKVYYDLARARDENDIKDVVLVRVEQLYPLPVQQIEEIVSRYKGAEPVWVQEEPANMGAWPYLAACFYDRDIRWKLVARKASASPASGFAKVHQREQEKIIRDAFN